MNATATQPRLESRYNNTIKAQLAKDLGIENEMQIPRLEKIVINMGVGWATQQPSMLEKAVDELTLIAGQKPVVTKAQKSIAAFKLREGQAIGTKVTLAAIVCGSFSTACWPCRFPVSVTSAVSGALVGRAWQLHVRAQRPDGVPGDQRRHRRSTAWHGHHDRDHVDHERGRQGAARCVRVSVQEGRRC